ncbi:MAG: hypothetical protein HON76_07045 [Candidatus Scalindua sp.]|jgi:hypothetical protein|nr:hypothetical protein [Candidatus Scalindua sp.]MBT5306733.1 hypothetical protein [Candidatus Scalindua sp.]MBT6229542.1 hypothetical protein [Candidatus Scalindua sp.]MBT6562265.1 hypothetical protein [Candidatus Scalindua sp.]MBT7212055.1 hypothetical protein [Candidatus Scalindua sp.]
MIKNIDTGSVFIIIITLILFGVALFTKGFTHDLLLEAGVFLISVKLIIMSYKNCVHSQKLEKELSEIKEILKQK